MQANFNGAGGPRLLLTPEDQEGLTTCVAVGGSPDRVERVGFDKLYMFMYMYVRVHMCIYIY